jgi:hypothetical protein
MTRRRDYRNSVLEALEVLAPLNHDRRELMARRIARRLTRERGRQRIASSGTERESPRTSTLVA